MFRLYAIVLAMKIYTMLTIWYNEKELNTRAAFIPGFPLNYVVFNIEKKFNLFYLSPFLS